MTPTRRGEAILVTIALAAAGIGLGFFLTLCYLVGSR